VVLWSEPFSIDANDATDFIEPEAAKAAADPADAAADAAVVVAVVVTVADADAAVVAADLTVVQVPVINPLNTDFVCWSFSPEEPPTLPSPSEDCDSTPLFDTAPFTAESGGPFAGAKEATFAARDATFTDAVAAVVAAVAAVDAAEVAAEAAEVAAVVAAVADAEAAVEAAVLTVVHVFENKEGTGGRTADHVPDNKLPSLDVGAGELGEPACPSVLPTILLVLSLMSSISCE
jgi:hypothetical protein